MKIDPRIQSSSAQASQVSESAAANASSGSAARGQNVAGANDTVELSSPLRVLQSSSADRAGRIERLKQLVQNGSYAVSAQNISRSLIQETLARASN